MPRPRHTLDPAWTRKETWAFAEWSSLDHYPQLLPSLSPALETHKVSTTGEEADQGFVGCEGRWMRLMGEANTRLTQAWIGIRCIYLWV